MKLKFLTVATLALMVTACGTRTPVQTQPPVTPVEVPNAEGMLFELDTVTKTIRPITPQGTGISQQVYYGGTGFSTTQVITDQNDTVYNVQFTLKNDTNQIMGADSDLTVFVPSFVAQTAANVTVPGGGIVNADGLLPDTFFPFKSFSNQVKPGDGVVFTIAVQVPETATKAVFSLGVTAGQEYNQIPITANAFMQPAYGKFNVGGYKAGAADQTRFNKPFSMTTCPSGKIYLTDQNGLWRLDPHNTVLVSSNAVYRNNTFIDCLDNDEMAINTQANQIYTVSSLFWSPTLVAGTVDAGMNDGNQSSTRFNNPRQIAHHGTDLYVADLNNRAIRKLTKQTDSTYLTSTVLTMPAAETYVEGVAVDPQGNIFFGTSTGIWRKNLNSSTPVKIVTKPAGYDPITIQYHPNGMILVSEINEHRIRAYTPATTNLNGVWNPVDLAGTGVEATVFTRGEPRKLAIKSPLGLTVNRYGTIYFTQFLAHNVMRIDRTK
ncbi:hypothetical protein [Deinococcus roseus]|uniref:SMP-30/Gluconolactonase/LRE-like region domain-containing protein n=1 Tax=Deinococcus roseus TaxID=392414 RepID=A0ABQ2CVC5_9DEIO|nr:hypothetical protein [Deinococcus roseus]GGJ23163.1 hypothetical protein GCM10008938_06680 [Deinococcus roseus]